MRLMRLAGYEPAVSECAVCGRDDIAAPVLDLEGGTAHCRACKNGGETAELCAGSLDALRFILRAEPKKVFSFALPDDALTRLSRAAERYVAVQLDRGFNTLDYYKRLKT
jgi:DNA repair protein RecO (recombination protein O)